MMLKCKDINLEEIILQLPCYIYWLDLENHYCGSNDLFAKGSGLLKWQEIIGKRNRDLPVNRDTLYLADEYENNNNKVIAAKKSMIFQELGKTSKGEPATFLSYKNPLYNKRNEIVGILGLSFDISQRVKEENKLKKEKETAEVTLEHIIATLPAHVYWKDTNGMYLGCNERQAHSLGLTSGNDVTGKTDFELPWETQESARIFRENDLEVLKSNIIKSYEEISTIDGKEAIVLSQKVPLHNLEGNQIGILGISMDITQQKETEKALQLQIEKTRKANAAKSEFLSIMSHEIRGPLANIISLVDVISHNKVITKEIQSSLEEIRKQGEEALDRIDQVRKFLDLEVEGFEPKLTPCNLEQLIHQLFSYYSEKPSVKRFVHYSENLPKNIVLDVDSMVTVLKIIIENAIRFTEEGSIIIDVSFKNENNTNFLTIRVKDTGKGMSEIQSSNLFKTFNFDEINDLSSRYRKPSVKLSIAKKTLQVLNGDLNLSSVYNQGTTVEIKVPCQTTMVQQRKPGVYNVLLVEDNEKTLQIQKIMLESLNNIVFTAQTGKEAADLASKIKFDFAFLDITLPDINGIEVAKIIHQSHRNLPIIAVTSHYSESDVNILIAEGFVDVLPKPLNIESLRGCLSAIEKTYEED